MQSEHEISRRGMFAQVAAAVVAAKTPVRFRVYETTTSAVNRDDLMEKMRQVAKRTRFVPPISVASTESRITGSLSAMIRLGDKTD